MAKRVVLKKQLIPAAIRRIWGTPPLLPGEDKKAYEMLIDGIIEAIEPNDTIQWLLVKDLADAAWEHRRMLGFKRALRQIKQLEMAPYSYTA